VRAGAVRVIRWEELLEAGAERLPVARRPVALTIGAFDGVHVGHQRLIEEVVNNHQGLFPTACTFARSPRGVLAKAHDPGAILSLRQKLSKMDALGIALVVLIDFSVEISTLTGREFLDLLQKRFEIRKLVVGYNFRMGWKRDTGPQELQDLLSGTNVELVVVPATYHGQEAVSSSRIRHAIREGAFDQAREMLGGDYCLDIGEVGIEQQGGTRWVRRAELVQVLPRAGRYEASFETRRGEYRATLVVEAESIRWQGDCRDRELEIRMFRMVKS
jgi:FAD synthase